MDSPEEVRPTEDPDADRAELDDATIAEAHQLLAEIEADLLAIEEALGRIEQTSYGVCEICSAPIEPARLVAEPATSRCADHAGAPPPGQPD